ncbi:transcriptional regulator [Marmoricola endophyticus]|uniref:Transcriptional regulator n=1 Tax=Marmoricola endophyticus TaxID=2040280 RepID=A0A917BQ71_9ACTN|nr:ROK family protein [Marmoricola endophyticus]GGF54951.1 transcriptional regulator [Marmoricola endophyticus]
MTLDGSLAAPGSQGSQGSLRTRNLRLVLEQLRTAQEQPLTQAELSRATGLASGTVSSIVRELGAARLVDTVAGAGRRGTTVALARGAGLVAGVDFGHRHVRVSIADMTGRVLGQERAPLDPDHDHRAGLDLSARLLETALATLGAEMAEVRNIGLGLPAPIADGVVLSSAILPGWVGVHAQDVAATTFGRAVHIDNDANLGALAEHRHGAARGHRDVVFVKVSSGVGAGLIVDDALFRGANGMSGELGHLTLDEQGPLCRCGSRGCLEAYTGVNTALDLMADQLPGARIADLVEAAREGNAAAVRVFEDAGLHLGWGLATAVNLLNPSIIVVGGDMAAAGDLILEPTRTSLRRHVLAGAENTEVVQAALGDRASAVGAMLLALDATDLLT